MRRASIAAAALLAMGACRTARSVQAAEDMAIEVRSVEALRLDSVQEWLVVELEQPRITLLRDSVVELRASAAKAARRVERRSTMAEAAIDSSARHAVVVSELPQPPGGKARSKWRMWLAAACAAAVIALSWRGIRLRR